MQRHWPRFGGNVKHAQSLLQRHSFCSLCGLVPTSAPKQRYTLTYSRKSRILWIQNGGVTWDYPYLLSKNKLNVFKRLTVCLQYSNQPHPSCQLMTTSHLLHTHLPCCVVSCESGVVWPLCCLLQLVGSALGSRLSLGIWLFGLLFGQDLASLGLTGTGGREQVQTHSHRQTQSAQTLRETRHLGCVTKLYWHG